MTVKVITAGDIHAKYHAITDEVREQAICIQASYKAVTPAMIGDFTGDTIKLLESPKEGSELEARIKAVLTGLPTAQQLIGRARWLMRVAVATATGAKSHKEAEQAPRIRVPLGRRELKLGPVELAFGTARAGSSWKGLLSIQVEPLAAPGELQAECGDANTDTLQGLCSCLSQVRDSLCAREYYSHPEAWRPRERPRGRPEITYAPGRGLLARNRFNSILAIGSKICPDRRAFIPYDSNEAVFRLLGPAEPGRLGFRLVVYLDRRRLELVKHDDMNKARAALRLALLSLLATPVLLGLGKGANRGFGRFVPDELKPGKADNATCSLSSLLPGYNDLDLPQPRALLEALERAASELAGGLRGAAWESVGSSFIPRLPVGSLSDLYREARVADANVASNKNAILGLLGFAASKISWKAYCASECRGALIRLLGEAAHEHGKYYHTWPLGLPREGKLPGSSDLKTGYLPKGASSTEERQIRRQSFLTSFTLGDGKVYLLGFPSRDLLDLIEVLDYAHGTARTELKALLDRAVKLEECRRPLSRGQRPCDEVILPFEDEELLRLLLLVTFNNYRFIIEYKKITRGDGGR